MFILPIVHRVALGIAADQIGIPNVRLQGIIAWQQSISDQLVEWLFPVLAVQLVLLLAIGALVMAVELESRIADILAGRRFRRVAAGYFAEQPDAAAGDRT